MIAGEEFLMPYGFARVAAASLRVHLGDVEWNTKEILERMRALAAQGVQVAVFPELCITGYTLGDLLAHALPLQVLVCLSRLKPLG